MAAGIERNEVIAVTLFGIGMLLLANPVFLGGDAPSPLEAQSEEIDTELLDVQELQGFPDVGFVVPAVYADMNQTEREVFDTGVEGIYTGDAPIQELVYFEGEVYQAELTEVELGQGVIYEAANLSGVVNVVDVELLPEPQQAAFSEAVDEDEAVLTNSTEVMRIYDYIHDEGTFYEASTESNNETTLTVSEVGVTEIIDPFFTDTDDIPEEVRDDVIAATQGERVVIDGEHTDLVRDLILVRHDGAYYQIAYAEGEPPITEAYGPLNFAGMAAGILFIAGGGYMVRRVYKEKTQDSL